MLILSRKADEMVRIGDQITIRVVDIRGDKVRLGFDAPEHVKIHRDEVYQALQQLRKEQEGGAA